jgi:hypothetical protein
MKRLTRNFGAACALALCASASVAQVKIQEQKSEQGAIEVRIVESTKDGETKTRTAVVKPDGKPQEIRIEGAKKTPKQGGEQKAEAKSGAKKATNVRAFTLKEGKLEPLPAGKFPVAGEKIQGGGVFKLEGVEGIEGAGDLQVVIDDVVAKLEDCCEDSGRLAKDCADACEKACEEACEGTMTFVVKSLEGALAEAQIELDAACGEATQELVKRLPKAALSRAITVLGADGECCEDGETRIEIVELNQDRCDDCCGK